MFPGIERYHIKSGAKTALKKYRNCRQNDKEASDEWSDVLYRIRCVDGKVEKLEENNPVDETEMR